MTTVFECHCCAAPAVKPGRGTFCAAGKCLQKWPIVALVGLKMQPAVDTRHQSASEAVTSISTGSAPNPRVMPTWTNVQHGKWKGIGLGIAYPS